MSAIRILDSAFLDRLAAEAAAAPRRRKNFNLHAANEYPCQRFFNALCADSYVQPHRHADATKDETLVLLRGRLGAVIFDEVHERHLQTDLALAFALDVRAGLRPDLRAEQVEVAAFVRLANLAVEVEK